MDHNDLLKAYYSLKNSPEGQIVLRDLENIYYKRTLISSSMNSNEMLLNMGAREVLVYVLSMIEEYEMKMRG